MKKPPLFLLFCGMFVLTVFPDSIFLVQESTGEIHGPYRIEKGEQIVIGVEKYTIDIREPSVVEKKLANMRIPEIRFERGRLDDVIHFLRTVTRESDPDKTGVNFILPVELDPMPNVTLSMRHASALQILTAVMEQTGHRFKTSENTVTILPKE